MRLFAQQDNQRALAGKYFNDSSFSLFAHELAKAFSEDDLRELRCRLAEAAPDTAVKVKALLEAKVRPLHFALFADEMQKHTEHLIFGTDNNLNISFDPLRNQGPKNDSLVINQNSESDSNLLDSFTGSQKKKDKKEIEFNGNESLSDDLNLQDLLRN